MIECPNCRTEYFIKPRDEEIQDEEIIEDEETFSDEFEDKNL
jgi:DNA-directed RNA polymerase subunit RPC12/RpoP